MIDNLKQLIMCVSVQVCGRTFIKLGILETGIWVWQTIQTTSSLLWKTKTVWQKKSSVSMFPVLKILLYKHKICKNLLM